MIRETTYIATLLMCVTLPAAAEAAKYKCNAAKEQATLGVHDSNAVNVTPDEGRAQCRFSVNATPAGSPPDEILLEAINTIRNGEMSEILRKGDVRPLGLLLLSASPEEGLSNELEERLARWSEALGECVAALEQGPAQRGGVAEVVQEGVLCRFLPADEDAEVSFGGEHVVLFVSHRPFVVIGVRNQDSANYLFIPDEGFVGQPPLQP